MNHRDAFRRAQRDYDSQMPAQELPDPLDQLELPDAVACPCGGYAVDAPAVGRWDTSAIVCSRRPACARLSTYTVRTRDEAVEAWNLEIESEKSKS